MTTYQFLTKDEQSLIVDFCAFDSAEDLCSFIDGRNLNKEEISAEAVISPKVGKNQYFLIEQDIPAGYKKARWCYKGQDLFGFLDTYLTPKNLTFILEDGHERPFDFSSVKKLEKFLEHVSGTENLFVTVVCNGKVERFTLCWKVPRKVRKACWCVDNQNAIQFFNNYKRDLAVKQIFE